MNRLIRKLLKTIGGHWLTSQVRAAAEGRLGPRWAALYWGLAGEKRFLSFILGLAAGAVALAGYSEVAAVIGSIATLGYALGFVDLNWRDTSQTDWLKDSAVWKFLAANSPLLTAVFAAALGWLSGTTCTLGADWCYYGTVAVTLLGLACAQLGLVDEAWNAPPPQYHSRRG